MEEVVLRPHSADATSLTGRRRVIDLNRPAPATGSAGPRLIAVTDEPPVSPPPPYAAHLRWEQRYVRVVFGIDLAAIAVAILAAFYVRLVGEGQQLRPARYAALALVLAVAWTTSMALGRAYEARFLGLGSEEFKRVCNAAIRIVAVIATFSYATHSAVGRRYVLIALPLATGLALVGRYSARRVLNQLRRTGRCVHRVVVAGDRVGVADLVRVTREADYAGMHVVGVCLAAPEDSPAQLGDDLPVLGDLTQIAAAVRRVQATTVAVTSCPEMTAPALRRLSWELEGTDVDVIVAPALTDIAGPRIHVRPVAGLPLLHIEQPQLSGGRRLLKNCFDRAMGLSALLLVLPMLLLLAAAVRLTSAGPALFRQTRIGRAGKPFTIYKFRSMYVDSEGKLQVLMAHNERSEGLLFKIRKDPRITRVGVFLRRYSLDELPQLLNVVKGDMSLVGPRPPLPVEVEQYENDVRRRLLVKPGLTGLWQVSGRSDLTWDESVRLDLHYVENWSLALDFMILWRTLFAVLRGAGAY